MEPKIIICGMEHTGTTLISDLFRQVPGLDSGFECGVLLRENPVDFQTLEPFADNMTRGWGITREQLSECCDVEDHTEFYDRLVNCATVLPEGTTAIFDKTPRYLYALTAVLERSTAPVVISFKDPKAIVCSDFKRAKVDDFDAWYDDYMPKKRGYLKTCYKEFVANKDHERVVTIGLEDLAMNSRATMERMFAHVGEEFRLDYAIIRELRYENTRNHTVSADIAFEYLRHFDDAQCKRIETDFALAEDWFYT